MSERPDSALRRAGVRRAPRSASGYRPAPSTSLRALLRGGSDAAFRHFLADLLTVADRMRRVRDHLARLTRVTGPQYTMIMAIAQLERAHPSAIGVRLSAVADYLRVSRAFVTTQAGILIQRRLLTKRRNPRDGRSALVRLSRSGERLLERMMPEVRSINDAFFEGLDARSFDTARRLVARLVTSSEVALMGLSGAPRAPGGSVDRKTRDRGKF